MSKMLLAISDVKVLNTELGVVEKLVHQFAQDPFDVVARNLVFDSHSLEVLAYGLIVGEHYNEFDSFSDAVSDKVNLRVHVSEGQDV